MIEISHVSKSFGRVVALRDVSLSVAAGERVAFVGSNGSGKTTLLRALLGLLEVEGRVTIGGTDVRRSPEVALRSVAYVPQIAPPLEAPVSEVVTAVCRLRGIEPHAVAERAARLGLGFADVRAQRMRDLSGGTKQKLLAALALAAEAPLLVCDEPTANLDAAARAAFFAELDARPRHHVTLLCSHRLDEVRQLVDRVVELREGRVERDAPVQELLADRQRFRVEIALARTAPESAARVLTEQGFTPAGEGRFEALVSQAEKVTLVSRLLRDHGTSIADLGVTDLEPTSPNPTPSSPRLKIV
ncbi:MAG: ATP-binding cassette domain-containing protein [Polyangiaceae bacterium]|nr:ATP-binding cassette domain-containing protein [Polyangiaceae bacterium]